jgi:phage/conjugal plasmid C-4 type zinc finger TraR family protein
MSDGGNRAIELAEERVEREREAGLARIRGRLATAGAESLVCMHCGEEIPEARRRAAPGCTTCYDCALVAERAMRRRA